MSLEQFKQSQKEGWANFTPLEALTTPAAARLVEHARVGPGDRVLDVACGTGVVAITAARGGARVTGLDLTPALLERARENGRTASVDVAWHEGDVEQLPFDDAAFDVVVSQFGHIFAPRPDVAVSEMLRVLRPGGTLAFSTWPSELLFGRAADIVARYAPPPPPGVAPPHLWGDPHIIRERLGAAVGDVVFARGSMWVPALSPEHYCAMVERTAGPLVKLVAALEASNPESLAAFRQEYRDLIAEHFHDNLVRQDYLMTRAAKA